MGTRRDHLTDAAIAVLGTRGVRALTHRAVDAGAGLPTGSASNHFRTRDALLDAVVQRIAVRERERWEEMIRRRVPTTPLELTRLLVEAAHVATGPQRTLTLARYAILVEAGIHPALRARLLTTGATVEASFTGWLRAAGSTDPRRDAPVIMNHWTGVVLHALAVPDPAFDPTDQITTVVTTVIRPAPTEVPS